MTEELVLPFPFPALLGALPEHGPEHRIPLPVLEQSRTSTPGVGFDSSTIFDWTTHTGAVLHPQASHRWSQTNDEGVLDQSDRSERFEFVSPPRSAKSKEVEGIAMSMRMWTDFVRLDPRFSASQTDLSAIMNASRVKERARANFWLSSSVTRLLHKCKSSPWTGICKSTAMWSRYTPKLSVRWLAEERFLLTPFN